MTNAEIRVGEYVRTKKQGIKKIDRIDENKTVNKYLYLIGYDHNDREYGTIKTTDIVKHSSNLIDLIEEGDYVNGQKVELSRYEELYVVASYLGGIGVRTLESYYTYVRDINIESIVTKEQMEAIQYVV